MKLFLISFIFALLTVLPMNNQIFAGNWNKSPKNNALEVKNPISDLAGIGINSMALWSGASNVDPSNPKEVLSHFKPLSRFGIKHVVLVSCADWIIELSCKKRFQNIGGIIKTAKIILDNTDLHVVIQLKAYKQKKVNGKKISELNTKLENEKTTVNRFITSWKEIANQLNSYPSKRLSFNLLNEPEFQTPKPNRIKRDKWISIANQTTKAIRNISPDRIIIIEGISKSLFADRLKNGKYKFSSPDELLIPIKTKNIIYAFHNYEPEEFLQQSKYRYGSFGRKYSHKYSKMVESDSKRAIKWANKHKVPIMLTETGCIGYLKGQEGPMDNNDCGKFAKDIHKHYIENGIGVSWWALEKEKTIYNRTCARDCWMPNQLEPNKAIFEGFNLKLN